MKKEELIDKWKKTRERNVASAYRLRENGQSELGLQCIRDNQLIDMFIKDLNDQEQ